MLTHEGREGRSTLSEGKGCLELHPRAEQELERQGKEQHSSPQQRWAPRWGVLPDHYTTSILAFLYPTPPFFFCSRVADEAQSSWVSESNRESKALGGALISNWLQVWPLPGTPFWVDY